MAGDPEVDFVQGSILCQESDWMGNRLNTDPPVTNSFLATGTTSALINLVHPVDLLSKAIE